MKKFINSFKKYFKRNHKSLRRFGVPVVATILIFSLGMIAQQIRQERDRPANVVWGIDSHVKVPASLRKMLLKRDDCKDYRGFNSQRGVGLWAVIQVEQDKFAKITHGCSWALSNQTLATKEKNDWKLVPSLEYFSDTSQGVPTCTAVIKYKVPISLEGFCLNEVGKLAKNPNL